MQRRRAARHSRSTDSGFERSLPRAATACCGSNVERRRSFEFIMAAMSSRLVDGREIRLKVTRSAEHRSRVWRGTNDSSCERAALHHVGIAGPRRLKRELDRSVQHAGAHREEHREYYVIFERTHATTARAESAERIVHHGPGRA